MWVLMSAAEREEFLAGVHVGVLSAAVGRTGRTLAVPVWYSYQPGGLLTVLTGRRSRKAGAIRGAGRFGLCVQDDSPPYRYVSVEGPVVSIAMSASRGRWSARRNSILVGDTADGAGDASALLGKLQRRPFGLGEDRRLTCLTCAPGRM